MKLIPIPNSPFFRTEVTRTDYGFTMSVFQTDDENQTIKRWKLYTQFESEEELLETLEVDLADYEAGSSGA